MDDKIICKKPHTSLMSTYAKTVQAIAIVVQQRSTACDCNPLVQAEPDLSGLFPGNPGNQRSSQVGPFEIRRSEMIPDQIYSHIRIVLSIILGLGITTLLKGIASIIEHPRQFGWSWIHMSWVVWALISIMTFWWWEFRLTQVPVWTFESYFFIVCYCALYFMVSTMLFPSDVREFGSYENYLLERRAWFFGLIALITAMDLIDTSLKGNARWHTLGAAYTAHTAIMLGIVLIGITQKRRRVQLTLALFTLIYQVGYFVVEYFTLLAD
ncbi:hypothetical protein [Pseudomonas rustica]|uniref:Uncharacterized protein n=1 Tax=Pseudomonas rustica TaxID=2827099 RepID=A0ABS5N4M5_9PSED|nr:hypothetical protein [Pseudomonas rustica]MBS4081171.1 hypothetical protein [Pseudomonas rustica]